jgi:hypothetical protein
MVLYFAEGAAQDTIIFSGDTATQVSTTTEYRQQKEKHSPPKATLYSTILPGLGQAYNKKYWKIPIIYGGLTISIYFAREYHDLFKDYKHGYADYMDDDSTTNHHLNLKYIYESLDASEQERRLEYFKDEYKRSRDWAIIWTAGIYLLNIIDALVDAHFYDYDISDELSLQVKPALYSSSIYRNTMGIKCKLSF